MACAGENPLSGNKYWNFGGQRSGTRFISAAFIFFAHERWPEYQSRTADTYGFFFIAASLMSLTTSGYLSFGISDFLGAYVLIIFSITAGPKITHAWLKSWSRSRKVLGVVAFNTACLCATSGFAVAAGF